MMRSIHIRNPAATTARLACVVLVYSNLAVAADTPRKITPLPKSQASHPAAVELGKMLFFDQRLSGDARVSCATCHDPAKGWADGAPLSAGYPGTRYFRNTPTVLNAARADFFHWDGRLGGDDLPTLVRDSINDSHFLSADGRIILERMKQVPEYVELFRKAELGEPSLTAITRAIAAFVASLNSTNVPFDKFLKGDQSAISLQAKQ